MQGYTSQKERALRQLGELDKGGQLQRHLDPAQAQEQWREQRKILEDRERKVAAYGGKLAEELTARGHDGERTRQTLLKLDEVVSRPGHALPYANKMQMLE